MKKLDYVYKVVSKTSIPNVYKSSNTDGKYELKYELNKETKSDPDTLGIFCFSNFRYAEKYIIIKECHQIMKCIPIKILNNKKDIICINYFSSDLDLFYSGKEVITSRKIKGTVLCSSIIPIELTIFKNNIPINS